MRVTVKRVEKVTPISIQTEFIKLESALKFANIVPSGGMAKTVIQDGEVSVNGEICTMRGKKLYPADRISFDGETFEIVKNEALAY